jgi:pyruvate dehydrogenase (quinone)/pyruvate oxidase
MAKQTAADVLVDVLIEWGVTVVFGLPGDGINGIMEALRRRQQEIRFVQVRHEESAAFMACGYAKFTGKLGVCLATSGRAASTSSTASTTPSSTASRSSPSPAHYHDLIDTHSQQDVDLDRVFMDVALYSTRVMGPTHVENVAHLACRTALSRAASPTSTSRRHRRMS